MVQAILGGVGLAADIASTLTRQKPKIENYALGSDGSEGAGAIASRRFAEDRVNRQGLTSQLANADLGNAAQQFEKSALAQGALANQKTQQAIGEMRRSVNQTPGLSAAQRAGMNSNLSASSASANRDQALQNTQVGQQIAGMNQSTAQQQYGNTMNEKAFDQSRLPQIQWDKRVIEGDNRLSDVLGMVSSVAGAASGGSFGDLGALFGGLGGKEGIRSEAKLDAGPLAPPAMPAAAAPPPVSLLPTPQLPQPPALPRQLLSSAMLPVPTTRSGLNPFSGLIY